ncbi:hypothetical protein FXS98_13905 [Salmonella enterica subsp. enterica]|nr:hypothetical protein [Salmonella enterica subsp. enterica serovar Give]
MPFVNQKETEKMNNTPSKLRFRRTLLFAAIIQATLPILTACDSALANPSDPPTAEHPRSPFRVDRENLSPAATSSSVYDNLPSLGSDQPDPEPGEAPVTDSDPRHDVSSSRDAEAAGVASAVSSVGSMLKSSHAGEAAASTAKGMVTGRANQTLQSWFSRFGNARVQLNADEKFSLKNSEFDLLHPWWETPENLVFSQGSLHRTDERTQANLGLGWRHWATGPAPYGLLHGHYMTGLNTFLDYDLSRDHARLGIGAEFWRDYFRAGANIYHRLTNWKNSPDIEDYEERPADGWDIRTEGWLPTYPQLGAKLTYEQYYGNDVGLFGYDNLQKDPHAFTAGLTWTPFPLMTLTAEQRQGKQGENDSRIGVEFTWHPDQSWQSQTDPDAVGVMRTLSGNRYDFVARNNNIVLEYRKKEVIAIALPERVEGKGGMAYPLEVTVSKAKYGLDTIRWEDADLLAAGGNITCATGTNCTVRMPPYHAVGNNTWTVGAVATDRRGNTSERVQTTLVVTGAGVAPANSSVTAENTSILADGKSRTFIRVRLRSADNTPASGMKDSLHLALDFKHNPNGPVLRRVMRTLTTMVSGVKPPTAGIFTEDPANTGDYLAPVIAGSLGGTITASVRYETTPLGQVTIQEVDTAMDTTKSTLTVTTPDASGIITANGNEEATISLTAQNKQGEPVTGEASRLQFVIVPSGVLDIHRFTIGEVKEIQSGVYAATLKGTQAVNKLALGVKANGQTLPGLKGEISLKADSAHPVLNWMTGDSGGELVAGVGIQHAGTLHVTDIHGNALSDGKLTVSVKAPADTGKYMDLPTDATPDVNSNVPVTVTPQVAGDVTLVATYTAEGGAQATQEKTFHVLADVKNAILSVVEAADTRGTRVVANGEATRTLQMKVEMSPDNPSPVPDEKVILELPDGMVTAEEGNVVTGSDGTATAKVKTTHAGTHPVRARLVRNPNAADDLSVEFDADPTTAQVIMEDAAGNIIAAGDANDAATAAHLTPVVKDASGNPLTTGVVTFSVARPADGATVGDYTFSHNNLTPDASGRVQVAVGTLKTGTVTLNADWTSPDGSITRQATASATFRPDMSKVTPELTVDSADGVFADGKSAHTFTVTLKDAGGTPLAGEQVSITHGPELILPGGEVVTTDARGQVSFPVTTTRSGHWPVKVTLVADTSRSSPEEQATFVPDLNSVAVVLEAPGGTFTADPNGGATFTASVKDAHGNLVDSGKVTFSVKAPAIPANYTLTPTEQLLDDSTHHGAASVKVATATPGEVTVAARWSDRQYTAKEATATLTFEADMADAALTLTENPVGGDYVPADGVAARSYILTLTHNKTAWSGREVTITPPADTQIVGGKNTVTTDAQGQAVFRLTSVRAVKAQNVQVGVTDGTTTKTAQAGVTFSPDETTATVLMTADAAAPVAAGQPYTFATKTVDAHGNALDSGSLTWTVTGTDTTGVTLDHTTTALSDAGDNNRFTATRRGTDYTLTAVLTCAHVPAAQCGAKGKNTASLEPDVIWDVTSAVVGLGTDSSTESKTANGQEKHTLKILTLHDKYGNTGAGEAVLTLRGKNNQPADSATLSVNSVTFSDEGVPDTADIALSATRRGYWDVNIAATPAKAVSLPPVTRTFAFRPSNPVVVAESKQATGHKLKDTTFSIQAHVADEFGHVLTPLKANALQLTFTPVDEGYRTFHSFTTPVKAADAAGEVSNDLTAETEWLYTTDVTAADSDPLAGFDAADVTKATVKIVPEERDDVVIPKTSVYFSYTPSFTAGSGVDISDVYEVSPAGDNLDMDRFTGTITAPDVTHALKGTVTYTNHTTKRSWNLKFGGEAGSVVAKQTTVTIPETRVSYTLKEAMDSARELVTVTTATDGIPTWDAATRTLALPAPTEVTLPDTPPDGVTAEALPQAAQTVPVLHWTLTPDGGTAMLNGDLYKNGAVIGQSDTPLAVGDHPKRLTADTMETAADRFTTRVAWHDGADETVQVTANLVAPAAYSGVATFFYGTGSTGDSVLALDDKAAYVSATAKRGCYAAYRPTDTVPGVAADGKRSIYRQCLDRTGSPRPDTPAYAEAFHGRAESAAGRTPGVLKAAWFVHPFDTDISRRDDADGIETLNPNIVEQYIPQVAAARLRFGALAPYSVNNKSDTYRMTGTSYVDANNTDTATAYYCHVTYASIKANIGGTDSASWADMFRNMAFLPDPTMDTTGGQVPVHANDLFPGGIPCNGTAGTSINDTGLVQRADPGIGPEAWYGATRSLDRRNPLWHRTQTAAADQTTALDSDLSVVAWAWTTPIRDANPTVTLAWTTGGVDVPVSVPEVIR